MTESPWIRDATTADFPTEAIERSKSVPVLVDFWASWCGPCKTLGPILEKLAVEYAGRFVLAKVDVDANQDLAQVFQIQSIPTVLLLKDGKVADGFMGALPEAELRKFLDERAPAVQAPGEAQLEQAREAAEAGDHEGAVTILRALLQDQTDSDEARIALCASLIELGRAPEAQKVFDKLGEEARQGAEARSIEARLQLVGQAGDLDAARSAHEAAPTDIAARIVFGKTLVAHGEQEEGLEHLLAALGVDPHFEQDSARKAMLEIFEALGNEHPLTLDFRRRMQVVLF